MQIQSSWKLYLILGLFIALSLITSDLVLAHHLEKDSFEQTVSQELTSGQRLLPNLTSEEKKFLAENPVLKVGVDQNWPPFEYQVSNNPKLQGITSDYLELLEVFLGVEFEIHNQATWFETLNLAKSGQLDLLSAVTSTPERNRYLSFTEPYIRSPMVIITDNQVSFIADINELNNKKVAVINGYASYEMLANYHPAIELDLRDNALEALKAVAAGEVYAFVDNLAVASYLIRTEGLANLKVSGQTPYSFNLSMAVAKDQILLKSILEKSLAHISRQEHNLIYDRWVSLTETKGFSWQQVLPLVVGLSLVLLVLGSYTFYLFKLNRRIRQINTWLKLAELQLKEKNTQLEVVSITDKLTGIYNRHYLDQALKEQLALALRYQRPMSIAMFDLDYFKKVNDSFGHQIGDLVLKGFADLVKNNIRASDVFGRWGGEEFLLICPETDKYQAYLVVEKIRKLLENQCFTEDLKQTVSVGVAEVKSEVTLDDLLSLADQRLYLAKSSGRNKIIS